MEMAGWLGGLVPVLTAIVCSMIWWKRLVHPLFFLLMATLAVRGLYVWLRWSMYMLEMTTQPRFLEQMATPKRNIWFEVIATGGAGVLTIVLGTLLLRTAMRLQARPAAAGGR